MKKQFQILAATFVTVAFISCSKEKIETPATNQQAEEVTASNKPGGPIVIDPLSVGLLGRFEFNANLKDITGKLEDAWPEQGRVIYTTDRKGQSNKAIRFNGAYGVTVHDIPYTPATASVSFWAKDEEIEGPYWNQMLGSAKAFNFDQNENNFVCNFQKMYYGIVQSVSTTPIDGQWHHIAGTRDNTSLKLYIDGVLIATTPSTAVDFGSWLLHNYRLGYGFGSYWKGSMDDLRFYKRVLSPSEIIALKNL
jgi:hypothetical protein